MRKGAWLSRLLPKAIISFETARCSGTVSTLATIDFEVIECLFWVRSASEGKQRDLMRFSQLSEHKIGTRFLALHRADREALE